MAGAAGSGKFGPAESLRMHKCRPCPAVILRWRAAGTNPKGHALQTFWRVQKPGWGAGRKARRNAGARASTISGRGIRWMPYFNLAGIDWMSRSPSERTGNYGPGDRSVLSNHGRFSSRERTGVCGVSPSPLWGGVGEGSRAPASHWKPGVHPSRNASVSSWLALLAPSPSPPHKGEGDLAPCFPLQWEGGQAPCLAHVVWRRKIPYRRLTSQMPAPTRARAARMLGDSGSPKTTWPKATPNRGVRKA